MAQIDAMCLYLLPVLHGHGLWIEIGIHGNLLRSIDCSFAFRFRTFSTLYRLVNDVCRFVFVVLLAQGSHEKSAAYGRRRNGGRGAGGGEVTAVAHTSCFIFWQKVRQGCTHARRDAHGEERLGVQDTDDSTYS